MNCFHSPSTPLYLSPLRALILLSQKKMLVAAGHREEERRKRKEKSKRNPALKLPVLNTKDGGVFEGAAEFSSKWSQQ